MSVFIAWLSVLFVLISGKKKKRRLRMNIHISVHHFLSFLSFDLKKLMREKMIGFVMIAAAFDSDFFSDALQCIK